MDVKEFELPPEGSLGKPTNDPPHKELPDKLPEKTTGKKSGKKSLPATNVKKRSSR